MRNILLLFTGIVVLMLIGVGVLTYLWSGDDEMVNGPTPQPTQVVATTATLFPTAMPTDSATEPTPSEEPTASTGRGYIVHSDTALADNADSRRVLFFYANWCPTCIPADAEFTSRTAELPDDVTVIRVNYNDTDTAQSEQDLANQYDVTYQHTFVQIDSEGNAVKSWNGGAVDNLLANIQ